MTTKQPDWEAIERVYRTGMLSLRAMAEQFGSRESTIRSRAAKHGWKMDLTEKVKIATKEKLSRSVSRTSVAHSEVREDEQIIEQASDFAASVVIAHRADLAQWRGISNKLREALNEMNISEENYGDFARSLNAGVDAQLKVIKGERQAYSLDTGDGKDPESATRPKELPTDPIEAARAYQKFMSGG